MEQDSTASQVFSALMTFIFPFLVAFISGCLAVLIIKGWILVWKALPT